MVYILPILAVLLGFVISLSIKPKRRSGLKLLLAFSGSFLLSLTVFELFPDAYAHASGKTVGLFIMLGILLQVFLEFFSKGAEHGHVHVHGNSKKFPLLLFISLSLHSLVEGFPLGGTDALLFAVVVHKVPVAIILGFFLLDTQVKRGQAFLFMFMFSLMTPIGGFISSHFNILERYETAVQGLVIGVFLHISTTILFESSDGHSFNLRKLLVIILGIVAGYLV